MPAKDLIKSKNELLVENFNLKYRVGISVRFWTGAREGAGRTGYTWTDAQVLGGHTAGVYVREKDTNRNIGFVALSHVEVIEETSPEVPLAQAA